MSLSSRPPGKRNYGLAAVHYRKALMHFDYTFAETEELEQQVEASKLPCLLNLAACKCQQEDWPEVLTQCRQALEINPRAPRFQKLWGGKLWGGGRANRARETLEKLAVGAICGPICHPNHEKQAAFLGS